MSFGLRPEEELYQVQKDPHCIANLAGNPEYKEVMARLKQQMIAQKDPRMLGQSDVFDRYPYGGKKT